MDQQQQPQASAPKVPFIYVIETILKCFFLVMSLFNMSYTLVVALLASVIAIYRVLKRPQMNKQYLARVLMNNHGQNILYIAIGSLGFINYLYYAPIVLFFAFNIIEFIRLQFPTSSVNSYFDVIRHNKYYVYEGKCKIQIAFVVYCIATVWLDFMGRIIKIVIMVQFMLVKYRLNPEFKYACASLNSSIEKLTANIGFVNNGYKKLAGAVYDFANRDPNAGQAQAPQQ